MVERQQGAVRGFYDGKFGGVGFVAMKGRPVQVNLRSMGNQSSMEFKSYEAAVEAFKVLGEKLKFGPAKFSDLQKA